MTSTPIPPDEEIEALIEWHETEEREWLGADPKDGGGLSKLIAAKTIVHTNVIAALRSLSARNRAMREAALGLQTVLEAALTEPDAYALGYLRITAPAFLKKSRTALSEQTTKPVETK